MKFEWDQVKAAINLRKHGITFEEAATVFYDEHSKLTLDPDHSENEERLILIGHSGKKRLLFVVHLEVVSRNAIRIISARKATRRERRDFEEI